MMLPQITAGPRRNGDGKWFAYCAGCKWRGATYDGPLAEVDANDDCDDHDRQNHG